jgi:hypothetical protein
MGNRTSSKLTGDVNMIFLSSGRLWEWVNKKVSNREGGALIFPGTAKKVDYEMNGIEVKQKTDRADAGRKLAIE